MKNHCNKKHYAQIFQANIALTLFQLFSTIKPLTETFYSVCKDLILAIFSFLPICCRNPTQSSDELGSDLNNDAMKVIQFKYIERGTPSVIYRYFFTTSDVQELPQHVICTDIVLHNAAIIEEC